MPDSPVLDVNELPVVRFENIPGVQLSEAVVAHNLPIRSAWQYFAFDSRTGEGTTKDRHNSASAFRDVTYFHRWSDLRSEEHTSELQSLRHLVCRLLLEKK